MGTGTRPGTTAAPPDRMSSTQMMAVVAPEPTSLHNMAFLRSHRSTPAHPRRATAVPRATSSQNDISTKRGGAGELVDVRAPSANDVSPEPNRETNCPNHTRAKVTNGRDGEADGGHSSRRRAGGAWRAFHWPGVDGTVNEVQRISFSPDAFCKQTTRQSRRFVPSHGRCVWPRGGAGEGALVARAALHPGSAFRSLHPGEAVMAHTGQGCRHAQFLPEERFRRGDLPHT